MFLKIETKDFCVFSAGCVVVVPEPRSPTRYQDWNDRRAPSRQSASKLGIVDLTIKFRRVKHLIYYSWFVSWMLFYCFQFVFQIYSLFVGVLLMPQVSCTGNQIYLFKYLNIPKMIYFDPDFEDFYEILTISNRVEACKLISPVSSQIKLEPSHLGLNKSSAAVTPHQQIPSLVHKLSSPTSNLEQ